MSYADVNGLHVWYEVHGTGRPLVLLHGGYGSVEMFGPILPALAARRRVIAVDLQGHGRTVDVDRPLRYESMADDVAALLRHLDLPAVDLLGYSLGGGVALRTAIQHPALVRRLVLLSTPYRRRGWYPAVLAAMAAHGAQVAEQMRGTPPHELYERVAPRPQDWPTLWVKTGELLRREYDWSAEVAALALPVLLVYADADSIPVHHMAEFFGLLGGGHRDAGWDGSDRPASRLAVLPGLTHYDVVGSPAVPGVVLPFLTHELRAPE
ncbi:MULTISPECIES: alpha/beta fold hydrolase [Micromonospora]|uniref:Alpha/beta fold hydrolase n=1 Tax=Micromonospora solifontis TaxID=2487138 RepID=A0ABX9WEP3_9ACTN|nr:MULTISPECIES: alpha/beta fold hydrolase [Micromonospora]NES13954.1 alpha/beta hydrolase [Micromonospora sp. PPF5-17B]NES37487.1 alpha/beta hydrolase [Micromonospora solifontis]NES54054.1 alpha/beta hydrolase [Micromonospora sp. PPF5-6]RNL98294.1 alpha/beta fold hydrolase [Micromonospora solifontis]